VVTVLIKFLFPLVSGQVFTFVVTPVFLRAIILAVRYLLRLVAFFIVCVAGDIFAFYLIAEFSRRSLK